MVGQPKLVVRETLALVAKILEQVGPELGTREAVRSLGNCKRYGPKREAVNGSDDYALEQRGISVLYTGRTSKNKGEVTPKSKGVQAQKLDLSSIRIYSGPVQKHPHK